MLVSIIIPSHNAEQWLSQAISSALEQSCGDHEVIVVDDASTDGSVAVAEHFGSKIKLICGQWQNGNFARNAGLEVASGEWIQFLDADDYLLPDKIDAQLFGCEDGVDMIYSPLTVRNESDGSEEIHSPTPGLDLIELWIKWQLCQTGAALWRAESLRRIGGWREGLPCCQDNELTLRALMEGVNIQFVAAPGAVYRIWSEDTVCRKDPRRVIRQKTELIDACLVWLQTSGQLKDSYTDAACQACFEMARTWAKYDLVESSIYYEERVQKGLMKICGPAAPWSYRCLYKIAGFKRAENFAAWRRPRA